MNNISHLSTLRSLYLISARFVYLCDQPMAFAQSGKETETEADAISALESFLQYGDKELVAQTVDLIWYRDSVTVALGNMIKASTFLFLPGF